MDAQDHILRLKVFISYSRVDNVFADRIATDLGSNEMDVLIDRRDIDAWEPWWERIRNLIAEADIILVLLSPDWIRSEVCKKELDFAESLGKRLSPVVYRSIEIASVPAALSRLNLVNYDPDKEFNRWMETILEYLKTDIEWTREYTRLIAQAHHWDLQQRPSGDLLRDQPLLAAERHIAQKPASVPPVANILASFLADSRQGWENEQEEKKERIERVMISQSQLLAQRSIQIAETGDTAAAILIALEALPSPERPDSRPLVDEARIACFNHLASLREMQVLDFTSETSNASFSADGLRYLTSLHDDDTYAVDIRDREGRKLFRFEGGQACSSHDGSFVVTTRDDDNTISIWDATKDGRQLHILHHHTDRIKQLLLSPDDAVLISWGEDNIVCSWETATGRQLAAFPSKAGWNEILHIIPGNTRILIGGKDLLTCRSLLTGKKHWTIDKDAEYTAVSPDGDKFVIIPPVTFAFDNTAEVRDLHTGKKLFKLEGHEGIIATAAFSPDGKKIVTGSADATARTWDSATGTPLAVFIGHYDGVAACTFDNTSKFLATAAYDNSLKVWDAASGRRIIVLRGHQGDVQRSWSFKGFFPSIAFSPDGTKLITTWQDKTSRIWSIAPIGTGNILFTDPAGFSSLALHPDGSAIAVSSKEKDIYVFPTVASEGSSKPDISMSPGDPAYQLPMTLKLDHPARDITFSPDGTTLAAISGKEIIFWSFPDGEECRRTDVEDDAFYRIIRFSPDGETFLLGELDGTVGIFDTSSGKKLASFDSNGGIYSAEFSPGGQIIATTGDERAIRFWNATTGQSLFSVTLGHPSSVYTVAFDPTGARLVIALDNLYATIWNIGTDPSEPDACIHLEGHNREVRHATWTPDGSQVVTSSTDGYIRIFDSHTGELVSMLGGHTDAVVKAFPTPDGQKIVSISEDNTVRTWQLFETAESLIHRARSILPRVLSDEQRKAYFLDLQTPDWYIHSGKWPYTHHSANT